MRRLSGVITPEEPKGALRASDSLSGCVGVGGCLWETEARIMVSTAGRVACARAARPRRCPIWTLLWTGIALGASSSSLAAIATYTYDAKDQITQISYDNGILINYAYDGNGNRTAVTVLMPGLETPTDLSATDISDTEIDLSFTGSQGATSYYIQRCAGSGCTSFAQVGTASTTTYSDRGLAPNTTYVYRVQAVDTTNDTTSATSGTASAETVADTTPPSVPAGLRAAAQTYSTVKLTWNASTDDVAVAGYNVYRNGGRIGSTNVTSYTDGGLSPSTEYSYTVSAYDTSGNASGQSGAASATTPAIPPPSAPTGLTATTAGNTQINLSWSAANDSGGPGLAGYKVYRNGSLIGTTASTSFSDTGVSVFNSYSYTVAAYDVDGNTSAQSATVSGATDYQITDSNGNLLSSASSMYSVHSGYAPGPGGAGGPGGYYYWEVSETVGSKVTADYEQNSSASPACQGGGGQVASGYRQSGCVLLAEPSVYGH
jgi:YD repeat-containing protein